MVGLVPSDSIVMPGSTSVAQTRTFWLSLGQYSSSGLRNSRMFSVGTQFSLLIVGISSLFLRSLGSLTLGCECSRWRELGFFGTASHQLVSRRHFPGSWLVLEGQLSLLLTSGGSGFFSELRASLLIPSSSENLTKDMAGSPARKPKLFDLAGESMVRRAGVNENNFHKDAYMLKYAGPS